MWKTLKHILWQWIRKQFHGNPLIEQPGPYLHRVGSAWQIGLLGALVCITLGFIGFTLFVIGVLRGWF